MNIDVQLWRMSKINKRSVGLGVSGLVTDMLNSGLKQIKGGGGNRVTGSGLTGARKKSEMKKNGN